MIYKIIWALFGDIFGACKPMAINTSKDHVQVKYDMEKIDSKEIYKGFLKLKSKCDGKFHVKVLFVWPNILQVLIGDEETISRITEEFEVNIC